MRRKCRAVLKKWVLATAVLGVHRSECSNEKLSESTKIDDLNTNKLPAAAVWQQPRQTEHFPNYILAQLLDRTLMKKKWLDESSLCPIQSRPIRCVALLITLQQVADSVKFPAGARVDTWRQSALGGMLLRLQFNLSGTRRQIVIAALYPCCRMKRFPIPTQVSLWQQRHSGSWPSS